MNPRQLAKLGVPKDCHPIALQAVQSIAKYNRTVEKPLRIDVKDVVAQCVENPDTFTGHTHLADLAKELIADREFVRPEPVDYKTWGADGIDPNAHAQMEQACSMPNAFGGALMADAHLGYGLPIGGVLALKDAICPYAVGVDIACRMKMTVYDLAADEFNSHKDSFRAALEEGTVFGVGQGMKRKARHDVMDEDWSITRITRENKDKAWKQLGTSGSGNHFVEWGYLFLDEDADDLGLKAGEYLSLLSHSGSRGTGASVCSTYSDMARAVLPPKFADLGRLAWLDMNTQEGQDYWNAMNLMGRYAAANHDVIHRRVAELAGLEAVAEVENHHNFAWLENHRGEDVYVHRKGATPAGKGVLGVIPGSMADPAYVVRGLGNEDSLASASHGAGRQMSRRKAKDTYNFKAVKNDLAKKGIEVLSAGADEVPGVYKNINEVMDAQQDLVKKVARFEPRMVKMCGDGSRAED
ncbi:MAG: RtcB family protein [Planctomycetaceae bacterium]|nr:RtcB family protein [Planctomycetaceae bacterium]